MSTRRSIRASATKGEAQSRALVYKRVLEAIEALDENERDAVLARCDPQLVAAVRASSSLGWFSHRVNAHFDCALLEGLGEERALLFWQDFGSFLAREGIFGRLVEGAMRAMSFSPLVLLRRYPVGYHFAIRHQGSLDVRPLRENEAAVCFGHLPDGVLTRGFAVAHQGALSALLRLSGAQGDVRIDPTGPDDRALTIRVRWAAN